MGIFSLSGKVTFSVFFLIAWCVSFATSPNLPPVLASSHILLTSPNVHILSEQNAKERIVPASLTKILTAYVVFQQIKRGVVLLSDSVVISENAMKQEGSRSFLEAGQEFTLDVLLSGMIVQSGNDAATALAEYVGGSEELFVSLMNQYAKKIGMKSSGFKNASGLPHEEQYTTAYDIALLVNRLIVDFPEFYARYYAKKSFEINNIKQFNRNNLLGKEPGIDGVKTGYTKESLYNLVSSIKNDSGRFISVLIGAESANIRASESLKMLRFASRFYETMQLANAEKKVASLPILYGLKTKVAVGTQEDFYVTVSRLEDQPIQTRLKLKKNLSAPIKVGDEMGAILVYLGEEKLAEKTLFALENIEESGWFSKMIDVVRSWF